jgi:hypothetical protein
VRSAVGRRPRNNDLAGFVTGLVCWRSRKNLLAAVLTHVLIEAVPALTLIHCGPDPGSLHAGPERASRGKRPALEVFL